MSKVSIKTAPLKKFADYSNSRVSASTLNSSTYVGVDNLLQNKLGKTFADYVPTAGNVTKYSKGDTLIGNIRPYLKKIWYTNNSGGSSADVLTIHPKEGVDPRYIYYNLFQDHFFDYVMAAPKGTQMPRGDKNRVLDYPIPDFEIDDQQKIASVLSALDDKIELNNKINVELEQMAKTLYDYWFVQFDFPDVNGKPYKSSGGAMVYNKELEREIPKDWSAISIEELLATSKNGDWGEDAPHSNLMQVYCVRGADINALNGQSATLEPPVRYIRKDHTDRLLKPDDLIVEISGGSPTQSTGRIAYIGEKVFARFETPLVCSNFCKAISLKEKAHSYIVKQYWNKLYEAGIFFNFEGKTSGIKNLMFDRLIQDVHLAIPSDKKLIEEFHKISIKNDDLIQNNLLQNKKLAELRDWLLPMLMNGQVTVK